MSFPKYPNYKASGVEWLGDVPVHWEVRRLKTIARQPIQNGVGAAADTDTPGLPRYVRITDIKSTRELYTDTFRSLPVEVAETASFSVGDILFACVGATFGKSYLHCADIGPVCYAGYLVKFSPKWSFDSRYVSYWSESSEYWSQLNANVIQSTVQNFSASKFRELWLAIPALDEQSAIASFLDEEMSKIDGLVEEQRRLIELLKEKRQAVISHAVTKGQNPHAPLKPSGIEWLGDVPEHWRLIRLRHACSHIFLGLTTTVDYVEEGGIPLVRALNINGGVLDLSDVKFISETQHRSLTKRNRAIRGDILLSKSGSIGTAAVVDTDVEFSIYESIFALRARPELLTSRYLLQLLRSQACSSQYSASLVGMGVGHLNMSDIIEVWAALPPLDEQEQIAKVIEEQTTRFDALTAEAERGIELLQERRTALISAAVTGQIDVRGLVAMEAAS